MIEVTTIVLDSFEEVKEPFSFPVIGPEKTIVTGVEEPSVDAWTSAIVCGSDSAVAEVSIEGKIISLVASGT